MTAALEGCEWSAARPGRTLPAERPGTYCTGGETSKEGLHLSDRDSYINQVFLMALFYLLIKTPIVVQKKFKDIF